ncbi:MAG: DMT family transporter [Spirochaetaceae bacterium]|jgi:drug/metabolite transporter (DMT)-like permease|nr:DMT family transporter [Spirochaetaceae bacterium]
MNKKIVGADILLGLTACIWGFAFVAQRVSMDYIGPFTYNSIRYLIGGFLLIPLAALSRKKSGGNIIWASIATGSCLFAGASLQQIGVFWTSAGNSGFLTSIYVVLVPVFGIFLGKKTGLQTWVGAALAFFGLFFVIGGVNLNNINRGDILTIIGGVFWAFHVLLIDSFVKKTNAVQLACGQSIVCGLISLALARADIFGQAGFTFGEELGSPDFNPAMLLSAAVPIIYGGVFSVGAAYTLQIIAQQYAPPAHASVILCMESVFAALGGMLLLAERPAPPVLFGFALMLSGTLATQWDALVKTPLQNGRGEHRRR